MAQLGIPDSRVYAALMALPDSSFIRQFVAYGISRVDVGAAYILAAALSACSTTAAPSYVVDGLFKARTTANLYALAVGPTGDGKSLALELWLDVVGSVLPALRGSDPTGEEALFKALEASPCHTLYYDDFGGSFLESSADPRGYRYKLRGALTEWFDGRPKSRTNARKELITVDHPRLGILGGCTPQHLESATTHADWQNGFLNRFFITSGVSDRSFSRPQASEVEAQRLAWLQRWVVAAAQQGAPGQCVGFGPGAQERLDSWLIAFGQRWRSLPEIAGAAIRRAPVVVSKVATIAGWDWGGARSQQPWLMTLDMIDFAITVAEMHIDTTLALIDRISPSQDMRDLRSAVNALDPVEWRSAGAAMKAAGMLKRRFVECMRSAVEIGEVEMTTQNGEPFYRRRLEVEPLHTYSEALAAAVAPDVGSPAAPTTNPLGLVVIRGG